MTFAEQAESKRVKGVDMQMTAPKIMPCLWFDTQAEEAAKFYASVFKNSKIGKITRYGKEGFEKHGKKAGTVMTAELEIEGQKFVALNGGPHFKFNEAVSFQVHCDTQQEIDYLWGKLAKDGQEGPCGWLKDKFGLSWQVIPKALPQMLMDENSEKAQRVMRSMLQMHKIDLAALERAQAA
jgi:predicted 3-demethylubiquinone-9 3-methyltransferase (glyoxalase superfamily)